MDREQMAKAFNEWMRRFIEEPGRFEREFETVEHFKREEGEGAEPSYGDISAAYLEQLHGELAPA